MTKLRVGLLFGGRSVEHEVSIASASSIFRALDPARYDVRLVAIDQSGRWHLAPPSLPPQASLEGREVRLPAVPGERSLVGVSGDAAVTGLDVVFPIVHGRGGEDGSLQGLLELAEIPYVGSGVLGSAIQMDKEVSKRLLAAAGLPVLPFVCVRAPDLARDPRACADRVLVALRLPVFVKPANLGSSVGIHKVKTAAELVPALEDAVRYDPKVVVEQGIAARDIEIALLGDDPVEASVPGEIRTSREWYDYEAKYVDEATELLVPAPISETLAQELRETAIRAFRALEGRGFARVDFLVDRASETYYVNELNSLPGFTDVSMYPRMWEASGLPYPALLDRLIELALESHRERSALVTQYRKP
ncbi:MAG TPA: D-alanine--D-alanine ligase family protein [Myxococcota bacterium]|nr:D-alanine--D-alanine ligase family protein [Myxococcota bacterium]